MSSDKPKRTAGQIIDSILSKIVLIMAIAAAVMTFGMAIMICVAVILRYFFEVPVAWATEFSEYLIFVDVMLAAPYVLKIDKHVRVDVVMHLIPKRIQRGVVICTTILGIVACAMTFYYGMQVTIADFQSGINLVRVIPVKKWIMMGMVPMSFFFCTLIFIRKLIVFLTDKNMWCDEDYADMEAAKMNPRYNTSASTDLQLDALGDPDENEESNEAPDTSDDLTEVN